MNIIPAIIPKSLSHLQESLAKINYTKNVQIDVVDGEFVNSISWPYEPKGSVSEASDLVSKYEVEVDLMVNEPVVAGLSWLKAGARALVFHIEGISSMDEVVALRKNKTFRLGLSLNNNTSLEAIYPYISMVDFIQVMGISEIGSQGQPFDIRALERIASLHALYPELVISVDGSVNKESILELKKAGASNFVVGSAIMNARDPEQSYTELSKIVTV